MSDEDGKELPIDPESITDDPEEDPVPLFAPGAREHEETELLEAWTSAPEAERIAQLARRPGWLVKAAITGATLLMAVAIVFVMINVIEDEQPTDRPAKVDARNQEAVERTEQRQTRQEAATRARVTARKKHRQLAKLRARRRAEEARAATESVLSAAPPIEPESPQEVPTPAPQPPPAPPSAPPSSPVSEPPVEATPGQAVEAFGPGP